MTTTLYFLTTLLLIILSESIESNRRLSTWIRHVSSSIPSMQGMRQTEITQRFTEKQPVKINTLEEFKEFTTVEDYRRIIVQGCTDNIPIDHPVIEAVVSRWLNDSKPGHRSISDTHKIALSIEGGGMRGCVSAGASAALLALGLNDAVDVVYGSSAGSMVGAYFVSGQSDGIQIYYDYLPTAKSLFIEKLHLLPALGVNLPSWALRLLKKGRKSMHSQSESSNGSIPFYSDGSIGQQDANRNIEDKGNADSLIHIHNMTAGLSKEPGTNRWKDPWTAATKRPIAKRGSRLDLTVFNLDFLLLDVMKTLKKLDWEVFKENNRVQPLHIITTSVRDLSSLALTMKRGHFSDLDSMLSCIRASMSVPGVTGPLTGLLRIYSESNMTSSPYKTRSSDCNVRIIRPEVYKALSADSSSTRGVDIELLSDAFLAEPIPYRSACEDGATDVIVLRTKPDPCDYLGPRNPAGLYDKIIARRFFQKYNQTNAMRWIQDMRHNRIYAEDVLLLNEAAKGPRKGVTVNDRIVHLLPIAYQSMASDEKQDKKAFEVGQLENNRDIILRGVKEGAGRVLDVFLPAMVQAWLHRESVEHVPRLKNEDEVVAAMKSSIMESIFRVSETRSSSNASVDADGSAYALSTTNLYDLETILLGNRMTNEAPME